MKLTALADVNGSSEGEKMSIAKFLCVSSNKSCRRGGETLTANERFLYRLRIL